MREYLKKEELAKLWMEKELLIFDFDGTLLDSMPMWEHIGTDYLISQGIMPPQDLEERLISMTLEQSGAFYIRELGLKKTLDEYLEDIYQMADQKYRLELALKPGALAFVQKVAEAGKKMCILTTTGRPCVEAAAARHGLEHFLPFEKIYTCGELGMGKTTSDIYLHTIRQMGSIPQKTLVFEDAPFAVKSAKLSGCTVCSVFDSSAGKQEAVLQQYADIRIQSFLELV